MDETALVGSLNKHGYFPCMWGTTIGIKRSFHRYNSSCTNLNHLAQVPELGLFYIRSPLALFVLLLPNGPIARATDSSNGVAQHTCKRSPVASQNV